MQRMKLLLVVVLFVLFMLSTVQAQPAEGRPVQYAVKYVCGWLPPVPPDLDQWLKPGNYATSINIYNHNPNGVVGGAKRVSLQYRMGNPPPPIITNFAFTVANRRTLTIDCVDIWSMAGLPPGSFVEGTLHIGLNVELPVTAVYTSQTHDDPNLGPGAAAGHSIDVERILPLPGPIG